MRPFQFKRQHLLLAAAVGQLAVSLQDVYPYGFSAQPFRHGKNGARAREGVQHRATRGTCSQDGLETYLFREDRKMGLPVGLSTSLELS